MKKAEELIVLRNNIVRVMRDLDKKWVTSDDVRSRMVFDGLVLEEEVSLEKIGNNLRMLKKEGVVSDTQMEGKRSWSLTGNEFVGQPLVKVIVAFPKDVHNGIRTESLKAGLSRTAYIVQTVREGLPS